jgi:hypothetical protein
MANDLPDDFFPPRPDNTLPDALPPPIQSWTNVWDCLQYYYPRFFEPTDPSYQADAIIQVAVIDAYEARPRCLSLRKQQYAQAMYAAYLLEQRTRDSTAGGGAINSGVVLQEREGDIATTYADPNRAVQSEDDAPPNSAWEKWHRLAVLCGHGAIMTRYGMGQVSWPTSG